MGFSRKIQVQIGQEVGWLIWEKPENVGEFVDYIDFRRISWRTGELSQGQRSRRHFEDDEDEYKRFWDVLVEVFLSDSINFLCKVRNEVIYQEWKGKHDGEKGEKAWDSLVAGEPNIQYVLVQLK